MPVTTNDDIRALIDHNHTEATQRFTGIEQRLDAVESNVAALDAESMSRDEITDLIEERFGEMLTSMEKTIDDRMIYYGRRALVVISAPAAGLIFDLLRGWLS